MNKTIVAAGAVLLIVVGGAFLYLLGVSSPEEEYSTTPTQWSQAGDYKIEETPEGTIVTNEKAGFSFVVPEGWGIEAQSFGEEDFSIELLSPDAVRRDGNPPLSRGCGIGLNTLFQEDEWFFWNNLVVGYQESPEDIPRGEEVIDINGTLALKSALNSDDPAAIEKLGEIIQVHVSISNNGVIEFGTTMMPNRQSNCKAEFDTFISSFVFN